jgi:hypothetical protein
MADAQAAEARLILTARRRNRPAPPGDEFFTRTERMGTPKPTNGISNAQQGMSNVEGEERRLGQRLDFPLEIEHSLLDIGKFVRRFAFFPLETSLPNRDRGDVLERSVI